MNALSKPPSQPAFALLVAAAYVLLFLLLDWASFIRPMYSLDITPWNPQPALAVALLLWNRRWLPLVWIGLFLADTLVRGSPRDIVNDAVVASALTLCYAGVARAISKPSARAMSLSTHRQLWQLVVAIALGSLASGVAYVAIHVVGGRGLDSALTTAVARYWVGDAVGMLVMLPMLLVLMDPQRRATLLDTLKRPPMIATAALIIGMLWFTFERSSNDHFKFFYLLILPIVWAGARLGMVGAAAAATVTQVGLIVTMQSIARPDLSLVEVQLFMAVLTLTALLLGIATDERQRADEDLRSSLRLAAAGQMAAALAHELSQPLTGLNNYASLSRMIATSEHLPLQERTDRLANVALRMADDAVRATEVVQRLREFFQTGAASHESIEINEFLGRTTADQRRRAQALDVTLEVSVDADMQRLVCDPVQLSVVVRNVVTNAIDAVAPTDSPRRVSLKVRRTGSSMRLDVIDSGPGVTRERMRTLFEPAPSDKPGGMGIGLSICRAIAEARGGQLWVEPGEGGHFVLTLPIAPND